jgi:choline dehydrogenase
MTQRRAREKEMILAAEAIQTPLLLQVSDIGPKSVLRTIGITFRKGTPSVGANLQDYPTMLLIFNIANPDS